MKKALLFSMAFLCSTGLLFSQGELDAYKMSQRDLTGTARSVSMGGAFGALGGDISGVAINPAGIGVYTGSEVVTTMNFKNTNYKTTLNGLSSENDKFKFTFDNFGLVHSMPIFSDAVPRLNVGFAYNRVKSFDRKVGMEGFSLPGSLTDHMARRATASGLTDYGLANDNDKKWGTHDWMGLLGFNSFLINENAGDNGYHSAMHGLSLDNKLNYREKGYINSYDFNIGTTISDILSIGLTLSVTDMDYKLYSSYDEFFYDDKNNEGNYYIDNALESKGTGWQVAVGAILKPIDELRIGVAYHSPTWYEMTDYYRVEMDHNLSGLMNSSVPEIDPGYTLAKNPFDVYGDHDYRFQTPGKWTFSLASVIASKAIISVDYELTDYTQMKMKEAYNGAGAFESTNNFIKDDFRLASALRVGAEYRFTPQFSGRIGYAWTQSPYEKVFGKNHREAITVGTISHFTLDGDTHNYTWGLGYRFSKYFYADVAFVYQQQKDALYAFSGVPSYDFPGEWEIESPKADLKINSFQGLLTLGLRF